MGALLALLALPLAAAERPVAEVLAEASQGLSRFTFDWPRAGFREARGRAAAPGPEWQQATYGLAVCLHHHAPATPAAIAEAATLYRELVARAPDSPFTPRALVHCGRIAELGDFRDDVIDLATARACYRDVMRRWPEQPIAGEAALRLAASHATRAEPAEVAHGVAGLRAWLAAHPDDPLAAAMEQWIGDACLHVLGDLPAALAAYRAADRRGLVWRGREAIVWWRMAVIAERLGDRAGAIAAYRRICTDAQTSGKAFEAQLALARLGEAPPPLTAFGALARPAPALVPETRP